MPNEKTLKRIVIILGVLLVAGFLVVVGTIIYRAINPGGDKEPRTAEGPVLTLPNDKTPVGISKQAPVIILKVRTQEGDIEELVFDGVSGDYLGKLNRAE